MIDLSALTNLGPTHGFNPYYLTLNLKFSDGDEHDLFFGLSGNGLYQAVLEVHEFLDIDECLQAEITVQFDFHAQIVPAQKLKSLLSRTSAKGQLMADCETYVKACLTKLRKLPAAPLI
ncbi:hypothetical protein D9M68_754350 [compost metagenome]